MQIIGFLLPYCGEEGISFFYKLFLTPLRTSREAVQPNNSLKLVDLLSFWPPFVGLVEALAAEAEW